MSTGDPGAVHRLRCPRTHVVDGSFRTYGARSSKSKVPLYTEGSTRIMVPIHDCPESTAEAMSRDHQEALSRHPTSQLFRPYRRLQRPDCSCRRYLDLPILRPSSHHPTLTLIAETKKVPSSSTSLQVERRSGYLCVP